MVNVTHDGNDGGTRTKILRCIFIILFLHLHLLLHVYELNFIAKLTCHEFYHFSIKTLVDRYHDTQTHTFADDFSKINVEETGELTHTDEFCYLYFVIQITF